MRLAWIILAIATACAGKAPHDNTVDAPAGGGDGSVDTSQSVSGRAMDYFANVALQGTSIASDGIDPAVTTTSGADASYSITVPVGSKLFLLASRTGYRQTRNAPLAMAAMPLMQDVYVLSIADVNREYTSVGKAPTASKAFLEADLEMPDGTPLTGIPLANVTLVDGANQPVTGVIGPYFFNVNGDIDAALTTATAYGTPPVSRVAFLDVPAGTYTLQVTYPMGAGTGTNVSVVTTAADGATLAISGGPTVATGTTVTDPHFATDIWPRLQKAANGGLGCANCHTAGGDAAVLPFDDDAPTVLAHMQAITGVINTATPATSLFLVRPLYEQPPALQDHPNATFLDLTDPDYKMFLLWITNGAKP